MSRVFVPSGASFPQVGENRTLADILDDLADYVGGGNRPAAQARARRALQSAVRMFNLTLWRFNRQKQTITLADNTTEYALNATFLAPRAALLLDTASLAVGPLEWVKYEDWARYDASEISTATRPEQYTARNAFSTGLVTFIPRLGTIDTQYPKVALHYFSRIVVPQNASSILTAPSEVEEAIVQEAVAIIVAKERSFLEARDARAVARDLRASCEREWRDWPDSGQHNES